MRTVPAAAVLSIAVLTLTACADDVPEQEELPHDAGMQETGLTVLSSIDVYADLIDQVAGGSVDSQAVVDSVAVDPHSYEAAPQDRLAVENADVIVANGGGYDSFITLLASSAEKEDAVYQLIDDESEHSHDHSHEHDGEHFNEHIWYDLERMEEFVLDVAEHLGEAAPENAEAYAENAEALAGEIGELHERNQALDAEGRSYLATEAVSGRLLDDAGFENRTPEEFLAAVEHGEDVSPRLYQDALELTEEISLLSYNPQTETQQSTRIRSTAEESGAVTREFTETLPEDAESFQEWMSANIDTIEEALAEMDD
ncbi:metal ABC transporter solute-binding protein, Zn/Mn family [Nesterenkonia populi]